MRRTIATITAALAFACLTACQTTPSLVTVETRAVQAVTLARQVSTASLRAGKITVAQDQAYQAKLDLTRASIEAAKAAADAQALADAKAEADKITTTLGGTPAP
jgi:soluble cytochrome b562